MRSARWNTPTAAVAPTTATNTPGAFGRTRLQPMMMTREATPITKDTQLVRPCATPCTRLMFRGSGYRARRKAQDLGQLADEHGQRDAVQIAQADGLGEQDP